VIERHGADYTEERVSTPQYSDARFLDKGRLNLRSSRTKDIWRICYLGLRRSYRFIGFRPLLGLLARLLGLCATKKPKGHRDVGVFKRE
jgi:hypothetical protein